VPRDAGWPAPLHDRTVVHVRFTGPTSTRSPATRCSPPLRTVGTPLLDEVGELSLTATDAVHRDRRGRRPGPRRRGALRELPPAPSTPCWPPPTWTSRAR
jgi:hypothetical protein